MVAHLPPATLSAPLRRALEPALVALLAALFVRTFVAQVVAIPSASMAPALLPGDVVLIDRLAYAAGPAPLAALWPTGAVGRGEVVAFRSPESRRRLLVKRCAAGGGEPWGGGFVPAGTLMLLGDARAVSHDSRAFGPVAGAAVVGRAVAVLWSREPGGGWRWGRTMRRVR